MSVLRALRHRDIRYLWAGQVLSCVGDEVYNIALVWYAAKLIGFNAGYVAAIQAAAMFIFSVIGGIWADHRDHRTVLIAADLTRGVAVMTLPFVALFFDINLWMLIPVAILVSGVSAFFSPALTAFLPQLVTDRSLLQTTNGLMETTARLARVIGPGLVALLSRFIPLVHYFTIDAVSFFGSAISLLSIKERPKELVSKPERLTFSQSLREGHRLCVSIPIIKFITFSGALAGATWNFIFVLGIALFVREKIPGDVGALGTAVFGYGLGNLTSNLIILHLPIHRPERWMYSGRILGGIGFLLLAGSQTMSGIVIACAIAATGGPLTDLGYISLIQNHFRGAELSRVYRYTMALSSGGMLIVLLLSPKLFTYFSVPSVIFVCALGTLATGIAGFFWPNLS